MMTPSLLAFLRTMPGRCHDCGHHSETQGHEPSCPNANEPFDRAAQGMARTVAAHPDDAAVVDRAIAEACRRGKPFSANALRHVTEQIEQPSVIGARMRAWVAAKKLRRIGDEPSNLPGTHAHRIGVYVPTERNVA